MKRVFIIHGWGGSSSEPWLVWLAQELKKKDYQVSIPAMPNSESPTIDAWVSFLAQQVGPLDQETHFVGHSIGCQAILRYLESAKGKAGQVILVAPWMKLQSFDGEDEKSIAEP